MNNFLKYPQGGGGGENIDVTPLINKDNLVSITGYIGRPDSLVKLSELNSSNNFNNIDEDHNKMPTLLEIKFKNISFVIVIHGASPIYIGFNKVLNIDNFNNDGNPNILIYFNNFIDGKFVQTTLGTYYYDSNGGGGIVN